MIIEQKRRSIAKAVSWRLMGTCATTLLVYLFTQKVVLAISIGGLEAVAKMALYFFHERTWNRIDFGKKEVKPFVLWFTGLSGSGKTTLANRVYEYLAKKNLRVEKLDGDTIRSLFPQTGFTKEERDLHIKRVGHLASLLEKSGICVIASFISPYREARDFVRGLCRNFIEIHVDAPVAECERRDVKGLYKRARAGEIAYFTGVNDPYEMPVHPEIVVKTHLESEEESFRKIKNHLRLYI